MLDPPRELRPVHVDEVICRYACPLTATFELGHDRRSRQSDRRPISGARMEVERLWRLVVRAGRRTRGVSQPRRLDPAVRLFRSIPGADKCETRARKADLAELE